MLTIVGISLALGLPSISEWIQNSRIRTAAESVQSGMQTARNEAVRRNARVEFILANPGVASGTGWQVRVLNPDTIIQESPDGEGSAGVVLTPTPANADKVTFDGLGRRQSPNTDGTPVMTSVAIDNPAMTSALRRNLRIDISSGGEIRMCDPNVSSSTDPRKC